MDTSSITLHRTLIRLARGMITAWEEWVNRQQGVEAR